MNIRNGLAPITLDKRDYSYNLSFGGVHPVFTSDYSVDFGKTMWDQNHDGFPYGCSGYTQSDNLIDEYQTIFKPEYTYKKTCFMEGHEPNTGCQLRTSFDSTRVYGVQALAETTDQEAEKHRGGSYYNIYDDGGLDWFDSIRVAIQKEAKGASVGTPWFPEFELLGQTGILSMPALNEIQNPQNLSWHNFSCKGWKTINGVPYLMIKSWQGLNYGDKGWCYMSRSICNAILEIRGSGAFIQTHSVPEDKQTIVLTLWDYVMIFWNRLQGLQHLN